ncbi:MAG: 50S ribosomal protein L1 [Candidatus Pacearchaeota archaeon]
MDIKKAVEELIKNSKKRNFIQTIDLIINLKNLDIKKEKINFYFEIPYPIKEKKVCLISEKSEDNLKNILDVIVWKDIENLSLKEFKKIEKKYDYFIALSKLIPSIAKNFGKILGSRKKMPDPQIGCIINEIDENKIKKLVEKLKKTIKIKNDGNSIKLAIGKENMEIEKIEENFNSFYNKLKQNLPQGDGNIKEILLKLTMSKPIKLK